MGIDINFELNWLLHYDIWKIIQWPLEFFLSATYQIHAKSMVQHIFHSRQSV